MNAPLAERVLAGWLALATGWAFLLFGFDKWRAGRERGRRLAEATLLWTCALGGWPGGLLGLLIFRHKSAKASFQLKFAGVFLIWAALVAGALTLTGRL